MSRIVASCVVAATVVGCRAAPMPYLNENPAKAETGREYCSRLAEAADRKGLSEFGWGVTLSVLGGSAVLAGTAMGPGRQDADWPARNRNTLTLGAGAALTLLGTILLTRSGDASTASGSASVAMNRTDADAMRDCLDLRAAWVGGRGASVGAPMKAYQSEVQVLTKKLDVLTARSAADKAVAEATAAPLDVEKKKAAEDAAARLKVEEDALKALQAPEEAPASAPASAPN